MGIFETSDTVLVGIVSELSMTEKMSVVAGGKDISDAGNIVVGIVSE